MNKEEVNKKVGERIKKARKANNMTMEQLAERMGYSSKSAICHIERGIRSLTMKKAQRFAEVLRVDPMWLIGLVDYEEPILIDSDPLEVILEKLNDDSKQYLLQYAEYLLNQQEKYNGN